MTNEKKNQKSSHQAVENYLILIDLCPSVWPSCLSNRKWQIAIQYNVCFCTFLMRVVLCFCTETATRLSPECCERLVESGATVNIFILIRSCNRSIPCMEIIAHSIQILLNLTKVPGSRTVHTFTVLFAWNRLRVPEMLVVPCLGKSTKAFPPDHHQYTNFKCLSWLVISACKNLYSLSV